MPVFSRRRHEIGKPIEELKRRELDDAAGPRPCGLPRATRADPVGGFVPGQHVTDAGDATARVTSDKEPLEREGRTGTIPQQMFETLKIAGHIAVDECDPDTGIDGKPTVLPGEHVGSGRGVEEARAPEPADHAATHPLGERGQMDVSDWPRRQERRRGVTACFGTNPA